MSTCTHIQDMVDADMPDLPKYTAPNETSDTSIELQFPSLGEVGTCGLGV